MKAPHLSSENACAKGKKTRAEFFVEECLVERGGCEVHQGQRDHFVQKLFIDANKNLLVLVARNKAKRFCGHTGESTIF